jgi:hypothetical protein
MRRQRGKGTHEFGRSELSEGHRERRPGPHGPHAVEPLALDDRLRSGNHLGTRLLDEVESRCGELAERHPDLRGLAEAVSDAAGLCDLAMTVEEMEG